MCGQFEIALSADALAVSVGATVDPSCQEWTPGRRVVPYAHTPVLRFSDQGLVLAMMRFSLLPAWAKEPRLRFSTFNARLDSVEIKSSWKRPFLRQRCAVPLTSFFEAVYEGPYAGSMVRLTQSERGVLWAAGIYDHWRSPDGLAQIDSFAIVTDEPCDFVRSIGHDRQPIFLNPSSIPGWVSGGERNGTELRDYLRSSHITPSLSAEVDRVLKPGWEKRHKGSP